MLPESSNSHSNSPIAFNDFTSWTTKPFSSPSPYRFWKLRYLSARRASTRKMAMEAST